MSQPVWKLVYASDCDALYTDETGVYAPELAILDEYETRRGTTRFMVYRFPLERCWQVTDDDGTTFLTDMDPARAIPTGNAYKDLPYPLAHYRPWFRDSLGAIARSCGRSIEDLIADLCTDDPKSLASAYHAIGGYHGWDNFDPNPEDWTPTEASEWPDKGTKVKISISTNDDDEGMVTLYCDDQETARDDQSVMGSRWEAPRDMGVAYASVMDSPTLVADLEASGYEVDASEWSPPTSEDLARWASKADGTWVEPSDDDAEPSS